MKNIDLKNIFKKKNDVFGTSMASPIYFVRDWKNIVLVFAFALISLSIFAWHIYLSDKIGGGYFTSEPEPSAMIFKTINRERLQEDLLLLENRQIDFLQLKATQPNVVDPSL